MVRIKTLRGFRLPIAGAACLFAGLAFYFLIIGIFEITAAIVSLAAFFTLAVIVWKRSDVEPVRGL